MNDPLSDRREGEFRGDRRRTSWREFRRQYPGFIFTMALALAIMLAIDGWLVYKRLAYSTEIERLRANMSESEREKTDLIVQTEEHKIRMAVELVRRQARLDERLHLSIPVDSATMYLEREGAILRQVAVEIGPEKVVGVAPDTVRTVVPRGERTVRQVLENDVWTVPAWVYTDRGIAVQAERSIRGALGPVAVILDGGAVIYSMPSVGPLADSAYVMPGSVRAPEADLRAILPNLEEGMKVYLH
ncbi:MAG TPA: hypothetical protein VMM17_12545 [Gemmatimonadaceae bacterium]|nr:hypothetical protein [Gemmatimonadaceae bacterium]